MNLNKQYNSKLLLFGEFVTIKGAQALAMPLSLYHGQWSYTKENIEFPLSRILNYLLKLEQQGALLSSYHLSIFKKELQKGLYFPSDIPIGYGLGSSGALCAAIYDSFCTQKVEGRTAKDLVALKQQLAQLESCFHGASSGTDPLICYLNEPVLIASKTAIETVPIPKSQPHGKGAIFLLNTHISRQTGPLVQQFLDSCEDRYFNQHCQAELVPLNDDAISTFLQNQWAVLFDIFHEIGHFQYKYFDFMIPIAFRNVWLEGLSGTDFKLKVCGAGGGGFILGMCKDFEKTKAALGEYELLKVLGF